jgi:UTP--glucose-1-phosphate uridylyltransferase
MSGTILRKALIPVAGLGTRMGAIARVVPKALLPLADALGRIRPVVHFILAEAAAAGLHEAALVVSPRHAERFREYLSAAREAGGDLPDRIEIIVQPSPGGLGEAILRGADFVAGEPFVMFLGDHVYTRPAGVPPCAAQVVGAFAARPSAAMIGMQTVAAGELSRVGVAGGEPVADRLYLARDFVEKPDLATARRRLRTPGLPEDCFLAHSGIYAFSSEVLDCLRELAGQTNQETAGRELELAAAQSLLLARHPRDYRLFHVHGRSHDTGTPAGYAAAFRAVGE